MGVTAEHICATTFHRRYGEIENAFRYRVDYLLCDLEAKSGFPALFSRNKANVTALFDKDHGGVRGEGRGVAWARDTLTEHGLGQFADHKILLLAQPRVLGKVFNPVSFWLVLDEDEQLRVVIAEVNNTFGERHSYLCFHQDFRPIVAGERLEAQKSFHVSPFQPVAGRYTFKFDIAQNHIGITINYRSNEGGVFATFHGKRRSLSNRTILAALIARPFGAGRVLGLIHWQAVKLWWKGAAFRSCPEAPEKEVS